MLMQHLIKSHSLSSAVVDFVVSPSVGQDDPADEDIMPVQMEEED